MIHPLSKPPKSRMIGGGISPLILFVGVLILCCFGSTILHRQSMISLFSSEVEEDMKGILPTTANIRTEMHNDHGIEEKGKEVNKATTTDTPSSSSRMSSEQQQQQRQEQQEQQEEDTTDADADDTGHFSACTLWMDDNHRLDEWLAYHYYILKLRYVIIGIDPYSKTSPQKIINKWNQYNFNISGNITIIGWNETEYVSKKVRKQNKNELNEIESKYQNKNNDTNTNTDFTLLYGTAKTNQYLSRQRLFMKECSRHMVSLSKTWVSYHDLDEYISFQHKTDGIINDSGKDITIIGQQKFKNQPYYIYNKLNQIKKQQEAIVQQHEQHHAYNNTGGSSSSSLMGCISIHRKRFCSKEDENKDENKYDYIKKFDTLRYKYLTPNRDGQPKSFIDLSQPGPKAYAMGEYDSNNEQRNHHIKYSASNKVWNPHTVMPMYCQEEEKNRSKAIKSLIGNEKFVMNHYLGSWESYSARPNDSRIGGLRTYDAWLERSNFTNGQTSIVSRPWFNGFIHFICDDDPTIAAPIARGLPGRKEQEEEQRRKRNEM
ncbi:hypothetical protein FRACYDRAFT_241455 [Fragilariopsis cylindrus CCMP1102]|uniref:Glycosyltransferase family 92 protein n=1 Tax=Fragilariopsis cylindrus CCMP1102 TaxID=635003 RepID=A0A1E7F9Q8_9STRA|nr:hypothetical protein FRACYDRAFT_241455 [Fragilariopsis cylindrus CCMP1102]|eukprot:OEU14898.1 hypothetical protein FRACYDRAFT_241455 [Fragilariopsis cylindrus CCMP1102]